MINGMKDLIQLAKTYKNLIDNPISDEDKVVHLLTSLPDSFNVLVTALEANSDSVPSLENVVERLLHEEQKMKDKESLDDERKVFTVRAKPRRGVTCYYCKKPGHFKKDCWKFAQTGTGKEGGKRATTGKAKHMASAATTTVNSSQDHDRSSEDEALIVDHVFSITSKDNNWIIDSGATCHMCNDEGYYKDITVLDNPQEVSLGDGRVLKATAEGTESLQMLLTDGTKKRCNLGNVLLIPKLAYNLLSISKVSDAGKTVKFDDEKCEISNSRGECIAIGSRMGNLYYLQFDRQQQQHLNVVINGNKERLWHRRYGHMGEQSLHRLVRDGLVEDFDYNIKCGVGFCESCIKGRHHKSRFEGSKTHTSELLELVHTDVCGKMGEKSIGGAEYFISFIDDKSHYVWTYPLKTKDQAFNKFVEWKIMAERESGKKLKILRSDNGGEYKSKEFEDYLKSEGIHHQCTIPKTPQQNRVTERFN